MTNTSTSISKNIEKIIINFEFENFKVISAKKSGNNLDKYLPKIFSWPKKLDNLASLDPKFVFEYGYPKILFPVKYSSD